MEKFYEKRYSKQLETQERFRKKILQIQNEVFALERKLIYPLNKVDRILKKFDWYSQDEHTQEILKEQLEKIQRELEEIKQLKINTEYLDLL